MRENRREHFNQQASHYKSNQVRSRIPKINKLSYMYSTSPLGEGALFQENTPDPVKTQNTARTHQTQHPKYTPTPLQLSILRPTPTSKQTGATPHVHVATDPILVIPLTPKLPIRLRHRFECTIARILW